MKRKLLSVLFYVMPSLLFAQDLESLVKDTLVYQKKFTAGPREVKSIALDSNRMVLFLLFRDKLNFRVLEGDTFKYTQRSSIDFGGANLYHQILGHITNGDSTMLILANNNKKIISMMVFDHLSFAHRKTSILNLKESKEVLISSDLNNDSFTLLTIAKKSSKLKVTRVNSNFQVRTTKFDLSNYSFDRFNPELYFQLIDLPGQATIPINVKRIDDSNSADLAATNRPRKIYFRNENIYLTLNVDNSKTTVIRLDLTAEKAYLNEYEFDSLDNCSSNNFFSTNSCVLDSLLFQVIVCKEELKLSVINMKLNSTVRKFELKKNSTNDDFKYSIFKEEIGTKLLFSSNDKYTTASKILRKGGNHRIAIGVKKVANQTIELDFGTYMEKTSGIIIPTPIVIAYYYKSYPYNIFVRNHLNVESLQFQPIKNPSSPAIENIDFYSKNYSFFNYRNHTYYSLYNSIKREYKLFLIKAIANN